jgi:hypothetical protein
MPMYDVQSFGPDNVKVHVLRFPVEVEIDRTEMPLVEPGWKRIAVKVDADGTDCTVVVCVDQRQVKENK